MTTDKLFINNFWDAQDDGLRVINEKVKDSNSTLNGLLDYFDQRISIEKEYGKKLAKLNNLNNFASKEVGSLKTSLDNLQNGNGQIIQNGDKFIKNIEVINYNLLKQFHTYYHQTTSKILNHINKLHQKKIHLAHALNNAKLKYQQSCSSYKQILLLAKTTWGKELERNEAKAQKLVNQVNFERREYQIALGTYQEMNDIFVKDWLICLKDIYKLEIEKNQSIKVNCFHFCNNIATLCVDNDQSADIIRNFFANVNPLTDLQAYSEIYGTGNKIYKAPLFMDFMEGVDEDNHELQYTVASFPLPDSTAIVSRSYSYKDATKHIENHIRRENSYHGIKAAEIPQKSNQYPPPTRTPSEFFSPTKSLAEAYSTQSPVKPTSKSNEVYPLKSPYHPQESESSSYEVYKSLEPTNNFPTTPSPKKLNRKIPEDIKSNISNTTNVSNLFEESKFGESGSSSKYSEDTNYSSASKRHWNSPRKGEKQLSQVQEKINLQTKELPVIKNKTIPELKPKVDIQKDFSIDFIAKALEDLNQGGDGDISRFRKSVRNDERRRLETSSKQQANNFQTPIKLNHHPYSRISNTFDQTPTPLNYEPTTQSDYVNDKDEVATRYDRKTVRSRPKSMLLESEIKPDHRERRKSMVEGAHSRRSLSKSPTKSYIDLNSIVRRQTATPVTKLPFVGKAVARYTYRPQHEGELLIKKGWFMFVIHRQEDNWFVCELGPNCGDCEGMVGLVPGNYLVEGEDVFR